MLSRDYREVPPQQITSGISIRWVIGQPEGAPHFALRVIEFAPGATFEPHRHPYEHEIFVLEGEGVVEGPAEQLPMRRGIAIYIPPDEPHGYHNTGTEPLRFICVVPNSALTSDPVSGKEEE